MLLVDFSMMSGHSADPVSERCLSKSEKKKKRKLERNPRVAAQHFDKLALGERLKLKPRQVDNAVKLVIANMIDHGLVPEDACAYYDDALSPPRRKFKHIIGFNPLPEQLIYARQELETALGTKGTRAVHVMGAGQNPLDDDKTVFQTAGLAIAVPGGLSAARQLMHYIQKRQHSDALPPLIVENPDKFWNPLLKIAGLMTQEGAAVITTPDQARELGIYLTTNRQETLAVAQLVMAEQDIRANDYAPIPPMLPPRAVLFFATGTAKKCRALLAACKAQGYDIQLRPIDQLVDCFVSPDEVAHTFQGNAAIKVEAALVAWQKMPRAAQKTVLQNLDVRPEQCFFLVEDSGVNFHEPHLHHEPEFAGIRHLLPDDASCPGVETGPAMFGGGGVPDFVARAGQALVRKAQLRGEVPDLRVGNISVLAIMPLQADPQGNRPITMCFATRQMEMLPDPAAQTTTECDLADFLCPVGTGTTERHAVGWTTETGQQAGVFRALSIVGGAEKMGQAQDVAPILEYHTAIFVPDTAGLKKTYYATRRQLTTRVQAYPEMEDLADVQQRIFAPHDGIVLRLDQTQEPGNYAKRFITYGYIFFSAMVAQQTRDKFMLGKIFAVLDDQRQRSDQSILSRLVEMTYDLHRLGAIPEIPSKLFQSFTRVVDLAKAMRAAQKETFRYPPFSYAHGPLLLKESGQPSDKAYHVSMLLTASLKNSAILEATRRFTTALGQSDIGVVSGAGLNNGGMGVVTHVLYDMAARGEHSPHHTGVNTPHISEFESSGNVAKMLHHYLETKHIYGRMDVLSNADTGAVSPGGAGTLQEVFAILFKMMNARENLYGANERFLHNQLVWFNQPIIQSGGQRGFYDMVLRMMPEEVMDDYPIHVTGTVNQSMDKILDHRAAMHRAGRSTIFTTPRFGS